MAWVSLPSLAILAAINIQWLLNPDSVVVQAQDVPAQAQVIDQRSFNVLPTVQPATVVNGSQTFMPPGISPEDLLAKPFHIYDDEFLSVIGSEPTLSLIAETATDPLFHEAVVWYANPLDMNPVKFRTWMKAENEAGLSRQTRSSSFRMPVLRPQAQA